MAKRSPIEESLIAALRDIVHDEAHLLDITFATGARLVQDEDKKWSVEASHDDGPGHGDGPWVVSLFSSVKILTYKLDLVLNLHDAGCVAIECDGHEWHERTKQQAAYDRARDRELLRLGIPTLRFTGSEIHHSASRCAAEVYAIAFGLVHRYLDEEGHQQASYQSGLTAHERQPGPTGRDLDQYGYGFSDGVRHFAQAYDGDSTFPEEHW